MPAMAVLIWSPLDGTRHSDLLNRTRPRAGFEPSISTHAEHKRTVLRPTVGRHTALVLVAFRAARALGRALNSPGLVRPPSWVRGSIHQSAPYASRTRACCQPYGIKLHVATLQNGRVPFRNPVAACHGKLLQHRDQRSAVRGGVWRVHRPTPTFEHVGSVRGKGKVERPPRPVMRRRARSWRRHARHRCR